MRHTTPILGCIADDFTGATDLCSTLVGEGLRVVQLLGLPDERTVPPTDVDAVVVALKSRSIVADDAVRLSLDALRWLQRRGAQRIFFKYCSTFDSTDRGNIGPVAEALLRELGGRIAVACPAFPENGRTVFQGHLFVGAKLLHESGMERHPLNPMTDANLVRVLERQMPDRSDGRSLVGLVSLDVVSRGAHAVRQRLEELSLAGVRLAIADAVSNADLRVLAEACADDPLITGGSGMGLGLPEAYRGRGQLPTDRATCEMPDIAGPAAVIAGSCSTLTLRQIDHMRAVHPSWELPIDAWWSDRDLVAEALAWAEVRLSVGPILIFSSAAADRVTEIQRRHGREATGSLIEQMLSRIAVGLVERGVRRLIVAGGETSGAVVGALGVRALRIGPPIAPGVPWTESLGEPKLALALKSGNFGGADFFLKALEMFGN